MHRNKLYWYFSIQPLDNTWKLLARKDASIFCCSRSGEVSLATADASLYSWLYYFFLLLLSSLHAIEIDTLFTVTVTGPVSYCVMEKIQFHLWCVSLYFSMIWWNDTAPPLASSSSSSSCSFFSTDSRMQSSTTLCKVKYLTCTNIHFTLSHWLFVINSWITYQISLNFPWKASHVPENIVCKVDPRSRAFLLPLSLSLLSPT